MARAVWGIDIGQCALKALRCSQHDDGQTLEADAFDYIEYPMLLSQPEADPVKLIRDAIKTFLGRNEVKGDMVAVSVSGQSGLARFIKLPPVESKKIPDIVKYEAKQQIPFDLDEVIWDYQEMPGASEEEGVALETEVGLFAMKRDQVFRALRPFEDAEIEIDIVQLAPLSIYNYVAHDILRDIPADQYDPANPPKSLVVISMGVDTTDLVVTNGFRVWQRNIPLGGNHFTKQLTKELKLTFAKAEHLKRNARQVENAKAIVQAMRPIYSDMATEIQLSIRYFQSIDRNAKIGGLVMLGNAMKLPGLQSYLAKNLGYQAVAVERFKKMTGASVVGAPAFKENVLSFGVCYGLCLQGVGKAKLRTSLLPREILTARLIRDKKPWAVAAIALLFVGLLFNFFFHQRAWWSVQPNRQEGDVSWADAEQNHQAVHNRSNQYVTTDAELVKRYEFLREMGRIGVVGTADGRLLWPEVLAAINQALPRDPDLQRGEVSRKPFGERPDIYIDSIDSQYYPDLSHWFNSAVRGIYVERKRDEWERGIRPIIPITGSPIDGIAPAGASDEFDESLILGPQPYVEGEKASGWVIQISGYHFFNKQTTNQGAQYVRSTLLPNLDNPLDITNRPSGNDNAEPGWIRLPSGHEDGGDSFEWVSMGELGIGYPVIVQNGLNNDGRLEPVFSISNPEFQGDQRSGSGETFGAGFGGQGEDEGAEDNSDVPAFFEVPRYSFVLQFCWQETRRSERERRRIQRERELEEIQSAAENSVAGGTSGGF